MQVEALALDAKAKQEQSQSAIAAALTAQMQSETPPPLLSEKDMMNPEKVRRAEAHTHSARHPVRYALQCD